MTINREKLANMTNEELAEFFEEYSDCDRCPFKYKECSEGEVRCKKIMLEWLENEDVCVNDLLALVCAKFSLLPQVRSNEVIKDETKLFVAGDTYKITIEKEVK